MKISEKEVIYSELNEWIVSIDNCNITLQESIDNFTNKDAVECDANE